MRMMQLMQKPFPFFLGVFVGLGFTLTYSGINSQLQKSNFSSTTSNLNASSGELLRDTCGTYTYRGTLLKGVIDQTNNDYNGVVVRQFIRCNSLAFTLSSFIKTSHIPNHVLTWSMESGPKKVVVMNNDIPPFFQKDFANIESIVLDHLLYGVTSLKSAETPQEYRSQIDNSLATYSW